MKKIFFLSAITLLFFTTIGCDKEANEKGFGVHNLFYTGCKSNNVKIKHVEQTQEYLELKANGKYLEIKHINAWLNCCPEEILVTSIISNDTIFIDEKEKVYACNCNCNYDLNYEIGALDYGKYHLVFKEDNSILKELDLKFNSNTNAVINIRIRNF